MMEPEERYNRDPTFRVLVKHMERMIVCCEMSGTEIREAAILALQHVEAKRSAIPYHPDPAIPVILYGRGKNIDAHLDATVRDRMREPATQGVKRPESGI